MCLIYQSLSRNYVIFLSITEHYKEYSEFYHELEWSVRTDEPPEGKGGGFIVNSLRSVRMVLASDNYEQVIKSAIALGNDTNITAAIVR